MDNQLPRMMRGGMAFVIVGGLSFLALGFFYDSSHFGDICLIVAWACGVATCIYSSAEEEIKTLRQRVAELEGGAG